MSSPRREAGDALRSGDRSAAVTEIRAALAALGMLDNADEDLTTGRHFAVDVFDAELDHAVRAFQQYRGLLVDGVVGEVEEERLGPVRRDELHGLVRVKLHERLLVVRQHDPKRVVRVSHMGFVVRKEGQLYVRHASIGEEHRVIDLEIGEFLDKQREYKKWPVQGIALFLPLDAQARVTHLISSR